MMLKTVMEVAQYYTVFDYGPPILQKDLKSQNRKIVEGLGMKPQPKCVLPCHSKEKVGNEIPQISRLWIIWKKNWPPQWIRFVDMRVYPLWRGS